MRTTPDWNEPTDTQLASLDETFTLGEMLVDFRRRWNRGDEGFWRVWGQTCEETLMELEMLRAEVADLRAAATPLLTH